MSEISWIKLKTTMFDDEKIRLIQAVPESDAILVIWIRLLVLAGKTNDDGLIYIQRNMPYSEEMLSTLFSKPVNVVRLALTTLEKFNMIDLNTDGSIAITNWEKHQNVEGMEQVRLKNAIRNREYRERKKQEKLMLERDVSVTSRDGTDIDKELDIDKDIDKEKIPYSDIIKYLNNKTSKSFKVTQKWKDLIKARWNEGQRLDDFKKVIDVKTGQWINNQEMNKYLRPATLFGNKFDDYLNEYRPQISSSISDEIAESQRKIAEAYEQ
ncbi:phage replisome organizer N-terminal domain-containing protein [Enterococcus dongliensis]|uniref:Phage replisome organizer N-terminal domain-containing protein n=1 Tax=Enterococcus dongliensis TaxID=2559925 RepID=A0ABU3ET58_9ENTE|nr:phage replisome organizer N-terminal domain-containing protein [Enterococcus dongliensis]MDT2598045.1 phage replisome organizer N-terminal domain-containing protein [Enterococcus dongliensis]